MKILPLILLCGALASCRSTKPLGRAVANASYAIVNAAMKPDNYVEEKQPPFPLPVKIVVRPVTISLGFGGIIVAMPVFVTGVVLQGADAEW